MEKKNISTGSSDEELMRAVCLDNLYAFELLYQRYKNPVIFFTCRMVQDYQKAEDITQEIFLRILKKKKSYDKSKKFSSWLYRIAANACIDEIRRLKFTGKIKEEKLNNTTKGPEDAPFRDIEKKELENIVKDALNKLPAEQKTVVILHKYQDLTYEEIAEIFNKDFNWVKWQLKLAYDSLEELLKPYLKQELP
ncbi:MAG: RNA polymerase sigma factor [Candidatus Firestonebacteria bacterium]